MDYTVGPSEMIIHLGPQHPMMPGPFRINAKIKGETVVDSDIEIGWIHKGIEKILENKTYLQGITIVDRICYLAALTNEEAYVGCVEKLAGIEVPQRAQYIRVIVEELSRIQSHLLGTGEYAEFLGFMSMFFFTIKEREDVVSLLDDITGARVTHSFLRFGGVKADLPDGFKENVKHVFSHLKKAIDDYEHLFSTDSVYKSRTINIGKITTKDAKDLGLSGPPLRASGVAFDIRKDEPYLVYKDLDFKVCTGKEGDVYSRVQVRLDEIRESMYIVEQCLDQIPEGPLFPENSAYSFRSPVMRIPEGEVFNRVEDPRGEMGFYMVSDGSDKPYRVKIRGPVYPTLQTLPLAIKGVPIGDIVAIAGSMDTCTSEVDR